MVCFVPPVGQSGRLQQSLRDFQPDYFSLSEKPPEEFCLSPNVSTSSSSTCSSKSHISVDLMQKRGEAAVGFGQILWIGLWQRVSEKSKSFSFIFPLPLLGLVKAVNTAVDLIVAHFGTSRDPDVKVGLLRGFY